MGLREYFSKYKALENQAPLDVLSDYLKQEPKKQGQYYKFQCPYCMDAGADNLIYNERKDILKCFASDQHAPDLISEIENKYKDSYDAKNRGKNMYYKKFNFNDAPADSPFLTVPADLSASADRQAELVELCKKWRAFLFAPENKHLLKNLKNTRGFSPDTVKALGIGYNEEMRCYAFPKIAYSTETTKPFLINFEFRGNDLSSNNMRVLPNLSTGLCQISKYIEGKTNKLIITEGFMDGIAYYQHLKSKEISEQFHIVTPSNGIGTLKNQIKQIDWAKYEKFILSIDNDHAGNQLFYWIMDYFRKPDGNQLFIDGRVKCSNCVRKCELYSAEKVELIEQYSDAENCSKIADYHERIKTDSSAVYPCKACEISNCAYKSWVESRCKDYNDYLRKALL